MSTVSTGREVTTGIDDDQPRQLLMQRLLGKLLVINPPKSSRSLPLLTTAVIIWEQWIKLINYAGITPHCGDITRLGSPCGTSLLDTTVTNCFKLYNHHPKTSAMPSNRIDQKDFRIQLAIALLDHSERTTPPPPPSKELQPLPLTHYVILDVANEYHHVILSQKAQTCIACKTAGRRPAEGFMKRKPLGELSRNINRRDRLKKRKAGLRRTRYGCDLCKRAICKEGGCWKEHLEGIQ